MKPAMTERAALPVHTTSRRTGPAAVPSADVRAGGHRYSFLRIQTRTNQPQIGGR